MTTAGRGQLWSSFYTCDRRESERERDDDDDEETKESLPLAQSVVCLAKFRQHRLGLILLVRGERGEREKKREGKLQGEK